MHGDRQAADDRDVSGPGGLQIAGVADRIVLEEFRLAAGTSHAEADRRLAVTDPQGLPLLTSLDDERDVASVRCVAASAPSAEDAIDREVFGALVTAWAPTRTYAPRLAQSSAAKPEQYRLAVTESGINGGPTPVAGPVTAKAVPPGDPRRATASAAGLLWIGVPQGSHAGLLVVLGEAASPAGSDSRWPLSLGRQLGVRLYSGRARA